MKTKLKCIMIIGLLLTVCVVGCAKETTYFDASNDITIVSREEGSGTRGAFVDLFEVTGELNGIDGDLTTLEAQITNSTAVTMTTVAGDEYAIGYISLGSLNNTVKALEIDGVAISEENIKSGEYKIARPFNIVTDSHRELSRQTKDFISFILSPAGQKVVEETGYIPLDNKDEYKPSGLSGKIVVGGSSSVAPVMEKLIERYEHLNPDMKVELQTTDSTTGVTATGEGSYDIGMVSRELEDSEKKKGIEATKIAIDGIAVIVNRLNNIDGLTSAKVHDIYYGNAYTWDEVVKE
ncbi:MAG: substrate-binding domain-containing protein [Suipraeoptans sp.]